MRKLYLLLTTLLFSVYAVNAQCPAIVGIMVDACIDASVPGSTESQNEFIFLRNGPSILNVNDIAIDLPTNNDITVAGLNDFAPNAGPATPVGTCFEVLDDGEAIAANGAVVIFMSNNVTISYDFTSWCAQFGTVYILYKNQTSLPTPTYLNTGSAGTQRSTVLTTPSCGPDTYTYNVPTTSVDGHFYGFPAPTAGTSISPGPVNNGCTSPPFNPLPVTLSSFTASIISQAAVLNWTTSTEINSSHFEIEKSTDGQNFRVAGTIAAAGNSSANLAYQYRDADPGGDRTYYRLNMVDLDGSSKRSSIVMVRFTSSGIAMNQVYPNPVSDELVIEWNGRSNSRAQVSVVSMNGSVLSTELRPSVPGYNIGRIRTAQLAAGLYFIRMEIDGEFLTGKFLKK